MGNAFLKRRLLLLCCFFVSTLSAHAGLPMISAGSNHSVVVKADGSLWAWGENSFGQLGNGTTADKPSPSRIGTETTWKTVSAGANHTVAIKTDGSLWAWGANNGGQLGNGTTNDQLSPVRIGSEAIWEIVSAGFGYTVAIKTDGSLWAWGDNGYGQLGDGTTVQKISPVQIGTETDWRYVSARSSHTMAIKADGSLWGWGQDIYGQLGDGRDIGPFSSDPKQQLFPLQIGTETNWKIVSANGNQTLAIKDDGSLWSWGSMRNWGGGEQNMASPVRIGSETNWESICAGVGHSLAIKNDGSLWAWGYNDYGRLGKSIGEIDTMLLVPINDPVQVGTETTWELVAAGGSHSVAVKANGELWSWGRNLNGQLGYGVFPSKNTPVKIGETTSWQLVSAGDYRTVAINTDGNLWEWGIGNSTGSGSPVPTQVDEEATWKDASAGWLHKAGLKTNGTLWAWGSDQYCQFGDGSCGGYSRLPVQTGTATNWQSLSAAYDHTLAIKTDGTLWGWGADVPGGGNSGVLGSGSTQGTKSPVQIGTETTWKSVTTCARSSFAVRTDGSLWAWGNNDYGQLGDGTTVSKTTPVRIGTETTWEDVWTGPSHTMAIKTDGSLWAWGGNSYGQLGDGTTVGKITPVRIGTETTWVSVAVGSGHSLAVKFDGSLWAWGLNNVGQLGDGTKTNRLTPKRIGTATDWESVTAGYSHSLATKADGSLWAWGQNDEGQLGDGSAWKESPVWVMYFIPDADSDNVADTFDNCPSNANPDQLDGDSDGQGNVCDADGDNDGVLNVGDNCPLDANPDQSNTDGDGQGDVCDADDDNDGILDGDDNCPLNANSDQRDTDSDAQGDVCDSDDDNDGVNDTTDASPQNPLVCSDNDADTCDDCSSGYFDLSKDGTDIDMDGHCDLGDVDDDGDGIVDAGDNCPINSNADQVDNDGDGLGNACDIDDLPSRAFLAGTFHGVNKRFLFEAVPSSPGPLSEGHEFSSVVAEFDGNGSGTAINDYYEFGLWYGCRTCILSDPGSSSYNLNYIVSPDRVVQIHNGIDTSRYWLSEDGNLLLFGGGFEKQSPEETDYNTYLELSVKSGTSMDTASLSGTFNGFEHWTAYGETTNNGASYYYRDKMEISSTSYIFDGIGGLSGAYQSTKYLVDLANPGSVYTDQESSTFNASYFVFPGGKVEVYDPDETSVLWLSADGNILIYGAGAIDLDPDITPPASHTNYEATIEVAVKAGTLMSLSSLAGTYNFVRVQSGFLKNGSDLTDYIYGGTETIYFDGSGNCKATYEGKAFSVNLLSPSVVNVDPDIGVASCTYTVSSTGAVQVNYGPDSSQTFWLSANGNALVGGGAVADGVSLYDTSLVVGIRSKDLVLSNPPASISVPTSDADGSYTVSWGESSTTGVTYVLEEATNPAFTSGLRTAYTGPALASSITGRSQSTSYYYRVKATKVGYYDSAWVKGSNGCSVLWLTPLNNNTAFVEQVYRDFLNREADPGGLAYWTGELNAGRLTRAAIVEQYLLSPEFGEKVSPVTRLYFAYFNRLPDYSGLMYWVNEYASGNRTLNNISDAFAASTEFQTTYGSLNNGQFVDLIYSNLFNRTADLGGKAYWTNELDSVNRTRGQVMTGFSESQEYKDLMANPIYVTMTYIGLLRRSPDYDGYNYWVGRLDQGDSGETLIDLFLNSAEYEARFP